MSVHKIAVAGIGKISRDQHLPVIAANPAFELVGVVSSSGAKVEGVPTFATQADLFAAIPDLDAVANCVPPVPRHRMVREALDAGKHVLIEKPPAATTSEFDDLIAHAKARDRVLFATWHSQYNPAVDALRDLLATEGVRRLRIDWRENVRKWHPGQDWVWTPGGFGVCDPGINALSILTKVMPEPVFVESARLEVPSNRQTPIDARIVFKTASGNADVTAGFNWLEGDTEVWEFTVETGAGSKVKLESGGTRLIVDGIVRVNEPMAEYTGVYEAFDRLLREGRSDTHGAPLQLMADAFFVAERIPVAPFEW